MDRVKLELTTKSINDFSEKREKLLEKAPFHFNVLDEARVDENAHSKILGRLLKYKRGGKFIHLESFYKIIGLELKIDNPKIRIEKERIDISILDNSYGIVIENKVHYAVDQLEQIDTYVKRLCNKAYKIDKNIYVIYLTRRGDKPVSEASLSPLLRKSLESRDGYKEVNFEVHILPWLADEILPVCLDKDRNLIYGVEQYIDHIKGFLNHRKKDEVMNNNLSKYLKKELSISEVDDSGVIEKIEERRKEVLAYLNGLDGIRKEVTFQLRREFLEALLSRLNSETKGEWVCTKSIKQQPCEIVDANEIFFGFKSTSKVFKGQEICLSVQIYNRSKFFCGFYKLENSLNKELIQAFKDGGKEMNIGFCDFKREKWVAIDLQDYTYKSVRKPAWNVYDVEWDKFYKTELTGMTNVFFDKIEVVYKAWEAICNLNKLQSDK